jgi:hypothetical protein
MTGRNGSWQEQGHLLWNLWKLSLSPRSAFSGHSTLNIDQLSGDLFDILIELLCGNVRFDSLRLFNALNIVLYLMWLQHNKNSISQKWFSRDASRFSETWNDVNSPLSAQLIKWQSATGMSNDYLWYSLLGMLLSHQDRQLVQSERSCAKSQDSLSLNCDDIGIEEDFLMFEAVSGGISLVEGVSMTDTEAGTMNLWI